VLVRWLDEDFLTAGRQPISSLVELRSHLGLPLSSKFVLLGPEDSTMLEAMVREAPKMTDARFSIYNFGATAAEANILQNLRPSGSIQKLFEQSKIQYYRMVDTDEELAEALACELMRRDANLGLHVDENGLCAGPPKPGERSNHIVLISDWDTVYGNDLSKTVKSTFSKGQNLDSNGRKIDPEWIRRVSYLRGLDGRLPDQKNPPQATSSQSSSPQQTAADQSATPQQTAATPETARSQFESAEGQSQFDYLRRLAADLKERDAEFRRTDGGHIAAVGVLGSDVYDKLLLLQALRPELPEALFFTTDLDELLLPQKKQRYTRNLLVASSFGLRLNDEHQKDIPPFRNTYQTSIFFATQLAIRNEFDDKTGAPVSELSDGPVRKVAHRSAAKPGKKACNSVAATKGQNTTTPLSDWSPQPLIFEIGRTTERALPQVSDECDSHSNSVVAYVSLDPPRLAPIFDLNARIGICLVPIFLLVLLFSFPDIRRICFEKLAYPSDTSGGPGRLPLLVLFIPISALWASVTLLWPYASSWLTQGNDGEPIALFEGISIWPTVALHVLGLIVSLFLIWYALRSLEINRRDVWREMGVTARPQTFWQALANLLWDTTFKDGVASLFWFPLQNCERTTLRDGETRKSDLFINISNGYAANWKMRCLRALVWTLLLALLWQWVLVPIFGNPSVMVRGERVRKIYDAITIPDVYATLFLTFLVADATLYSRSFIIRLTAIATKWPSATVAGLKERFNLKHNDDLADWLDMQYLARRTKCINTLIYLPFMALALLIISRSHIFDDFYNPWTLPVAQTISLIVVIASVYAYRSAAEAARTVACEHLNKRIVAATGAGDQARASQLQMLLDEVKNLSEGAFAPWASQPIVKAVLLPLLTYGGTLLVHVYALPGN
jgi:hypothetical protein